MCRVVPSSTGVAILSAIAVLLVAPPRLLPFSLALVSPGVAARPAAVETPRTIRVVIDNAYAPFVFQSDEGTLQGILIDQWRVWEQTTGIKVEIRAMDWDEALRRMRAGEFDVIDCIVETDERRNYFDFTTAYTAVEASIYFRNDISGITDLASLKGFPVGVKTGDQHIDQLEAAGVTTVIPFQNNDAIIEAAKRRKINTFVVDDPSALHLLNRMGIEAEFRHSAPIFRDELRRAVRKGDAALLRTVSEGFAAIEPAELKRIDEKWFGRTIHRIGRYLAYASYAAATAILLIAGLVGWNRTLRKGILQRTAALGESERRFRQIAENIREVFWVWDGVGERVTFVSPVYEEVFGRSCASLYEDSRSFLDAIHMDDRARVEAAMVRQQAGTPTDERYRVIRPDGSVRWIRDRAFPVAERTGPIKRVVGVAEDITDAQRHLEDIRLTEAALRSSEERWRLVFENSAIGIAITDADDRFIATNPAFQALVGYSDDELQKLTGADITSDEDLARTRDVNQQLWSGLHREVQIEEQYRRKDRRLISVRRTASLLPGTDRSPRRLLGLVENVTARKRAEQELDASIRQLHTLAGRLMRAQDDERRRVAQMLHETTAQDLAALKMHLARLNRTAGHWDEIDRGALTESISLADQSITGIRTLSYLLHPPFLDETGLLLALRWYAAGFSERSGITVDLELPESFERLPLDTETALFRIVQESLINIHRHAGSETARIRLRCDAETLVLEIEDQGRGIPSVSLEHIMSGGGIVGVGIAGMSERIEQLGGRFEIASDHHGTTVRARLPLVKDPMEDMS